MAEVQHLIQVSDYEQRLMVNGLNAFRNDLIREGKPTEDINARLMKVIDAPEKKPKRKFDRERYALQANFRSRSLRSCPHCLACPTCPPPFGPSSGFAVACL